MVLEEESYGKTYILHAAQVTYQKKRLRDTLKIKDRQTASKESLFPLFFMKRYQKTADSVICSFCLFELACVQPVIVFMCFH